VFNETELTMQTARIDNSFEFARQPQEQTFSTVWGNEMQREDFLALATGLRHYQASLAAVDSELSPAATQTHNE
jgi:hypothetical protein